ncbi:hypothetical protein UY3_11721 [Chelonia mydas]|uniref:Uncharacterized protein n=1 Tax=Chelonia mydas TaxID=8469 RepID=M7BSM8_CHEMY|nr:hypothetical protein UY3_11721 [Chelonia mydas]
MHHGTCSSIDENGGTKQLNYNSKISDKFLETIHLQKLSIANSIELNNDVNGKTLTNIHAWPQIGDADRCMEGTAGGTAVLEELPVWGAAPGPLPHVLLLSPLQFPVQPGSSVDICIR